MSERDDVIAGRRVRARRRAYDRPERPHDRRGAAGAVGDCVSDVKGRRRRRSRWMRAGTGAPPARARRVRGAPREQPRARDRQRRVARADDVARAQARPHGASGRRGRGDAKRGRRAVAVRRRRAGSGPAGGVTDPRLERWLDALLETPGLTAIADRERGAPRPRRGEPRGAAGARALRRADRRRRVGRRLARHPSRGCASRPRGDAARGKWAKGGCLERFAATSRTSRSFAAAPRSSRSTTYGVAVARALAPPPVAAEWCLPLVGHGWSRGALRGADRRRWATERARHGRSVAVRSRAAAASSSIPKVGADAGRVSATAWDGAKAPAGLIADRPPGEDN